MIPGLGKLAKHMWIVQDIRLCILIPLAIVCVGTFVRTHTTRVQIAAPALADPHTRKTNDE
jgi:hypothetical protein